MLAKENNDAKSCNAIESLRPQFCEDPRREPHEKETAIHLEGDASRASVTSFKKVTYMKILQHSDFDLQRLNILDETGRERTVQSLDEIIDSPTLKIIGASGTIPVGCVSIGSGRNSDSHALIVKP